MSGVDSGEESAVIVPKMTDGAGEIPRGADQGRGLRGGSGPIVNAPPVVLAVIAILLAIYLAIWFGGQNWDIWSLRNFSLIPVRFEGVKSIDMVEGSQYWSLVTYAFLHGSWMHVLLNSLWLLIFGTPVARQLGTSRFLLVSLVATLGGALVMVAVYWGSAIPVVGASAAVSGLVAAAIPIMFGRPGQPLTFAEYLRDRRAIIFTVVFLLITLSSGVEVTPTFSDGARIAWEAHLGGFAAGFVAYFFVSREGVREP